MPGSGCSTVESWMPGADEMQNGRDSDEFTKMSLDGAEYNRSQLRTQTVARQKKMIKITITKLDVSK
ncbi:hypothetical protein EVAR_18546_1 [Eumeta japonica]|uniref:Uncharacterized protein n=1 Tax=Eumeta variegata TaxID=151549 RepID=A0A4C1V2L7_EUMVA|nr:hypothetical protein EVAR_18546_1 [Eumeta japonica]